jgi:phosphoenolpyruvate---glycerone phosphotransferase subunit DhaL
VTSLIAVIAAVAVRVRDAADELNQLDAQAGDGDLGVTMSTAATPVLALLPTCDASGPDEVLKACGVTIAREAPSTCGTLVATALLRAGAALHADEQLSVGRLLEHGAAAVMARGKAEPGSKTLLDALVPATEAALRAEAAGASLRHVLEVAASAAEAGARSTLSMRPRHGRAGWLAERSIGHEDAGAHLIAIAMRAVASVMS